MDEKLRQSFHVLLGFFFLSVFFLFGREAALALLFLAVLCALCVVHLCAMRFPLPFLDPFFAHLERKGVVQGAGALWYLCGMLLLCSFLQNDLRIAASLYIVSIGDGFSTLAGKFLGSHPLPYNKKKTMEGTLAFALSCAPLLFFSPAFFAVSLACAFAEGLPFWEGKPKIDDNLAVSICALLLFSAI